MAERGHRDKYMKASRLPISRVKTIMRSSPEVSNLSPDSIFLVTKAAEVFVAHLAQKAWENSGRTNKVDYSDLAGAVNNEDYLSFLVDIIPKKITAKEYFNILKKVEAKEAAELREQEDNA